MLSFLFLAAFRRRTPGLFHPCGGWRVTGPSCLWVLCSFLHPKGWEEWTKELTSRAVSGLLTVPGPPQGIHPRLNTQHMLSKATLLLFVCAHSDVWRCVCTHTHTEARGQTAGAILCFETGIGPQSPEIQPPLPVQHCGYKQAPSYSSILFVLIIKSTSFPQTPWAQVSSLREQKGPHHCGGR